MDIIHSKPRSDREKGLAGRGGDDLLVLKMRSAKARAVRTRTYPERWRPALAEDGKPRRGTRSPHAARVSVPDRSPEGGQGLRGRNPVTPEQTLATPRSLRPERTLPRAADPLRCRAAKPQLPLSLSPRTTAPQSWASRSTQTQAGVAAAFTKEPPQSPPPEGAPPLNQGLLGNVVPTGPSPPALGHHQPHANYYSQRRHSGGCYRGDSGGHLPPRKVRGRSVGKTVSRVNGGHRPEGPPLGARLERRRSRQVEA